MPGAAHWSFLTETYRYLAEARLGQGRVDEALAAARQALALAREGDSPQYTGAAWRVLGKVAALLDFEFSTADPGLNDRDTVPKSEIRNPKSDAAACFTESLRVLSESGMKGERAWTLRAWAQYELDNGDSARGEAMRGEISRLDAKMDSHFRWIMGLMIPLVLGVVAMFIRAFLLGPTP